MNPLAELYALMAYANEGLGLVRSVFVQMALVAEEEPDKETLQEVERLRKVV